MEREVVFSKNVEIYLNELMLLLFEKGYFSFPDSAKQYVDTLILYIEKNVGTIQGKVAPDYFNRFGKNMKYITYRSNKNTMWYVFYQECKNIFLIRYISNNHISAQYL